MVNTCVVGVGGKGVWVAVGSTVAVAEGVRALMRVNSAWTVPAASVYAYPGSCCVRFVNELHALRITNVVRRVIEPHTFSFFDNINDPP